NTFAHISTSMTNNETIGFIQIKHSFFEYKSRKEKREEKYGRIRMDTYYPIVNRAAERIYFY
ncbi:MAG: hypothetical protein ACRCY5_01740, partial [Phocaeicola sp.]